MMDVQAIIAIGEKINTIDASIEQLQQDRQALLSELEALLEKSIDKPKKKKKGRKPVKRNGHKPSRWNWTGPSIRERLVAAFPFDEPIRVKALLQRSTVPEGSYDSARTELTKMVQDGLIDRVEKGVYLMTKPDMTRATG